MVAPGTAVGDTVSLIVSPNGIILPSMEDSQIPIVMNEQPGTEAVDFPPVLCSFRASMPEHYREFSRKNVEDHELQAALFECCGVPGFAAIIPDRLFAYGEWKPLNSNIPLFTVVGKC